MEIQACECGSKDYDMSGGFGMDFCLMCGLGRTSQMDIVPVGYTHQNPIPGHQSYTRLKRFKKYLCRAMRQQSSCTVPRETWDYLLAHRPYRNAKHIQITLKQARHLKRKCYDSLPFLTSLLCPHIEVPSLNEIEKVRALQMFNVIDRAIRGGPFVSYLFCLEFILKRMGRHDVCENINQIQCPKRRAAYQQRLRVIFESEGLPTVQRKNDVMSLLRTHV